VEAAASATSTTATSAVATPTAATTRVASHFCQTRIDALLGFSQDTDEFACLLCVCEIVSGFIQE
jgi:hypothetical protein